MPKRETIVLLNGNEASTESIEQIVTDMPFHVCVTAEGCGIDWGKLARRHDAHLIDGCGIKLRVADPGDDTDAARKLLKERLTHIVCDIASLPKGAKD